MPEKNLQISKKATRFWPVISGAVALVLTASLGLIITLRASANVVDEEWMGEIVEHRSPLWDAPSYVLNFVGTGWFATLVSVLIVATLFFVLKRRWTALYALLAIGLSAVVVQGLKVAFGRLRPEDILLSLDSGSFPSGHVANAATLAAVLAIVTWRWWVVLVGSVYVILMALSRTYLGAHWVSDTVGGLLIGAGAAIILWAPFAFRMLRERRGEVPVAPQPADTAAGQEARDNGSPNQ